MSDINWVAGLLSKLGVKSEDAKKAVDALSEHEIAKAPPHAQTLDGGEIVHDRWEYGQMHKVPPANVLRVGPTEQASGGGAEKMVGDYSNPARQMGIQIEAERLAAELGSLRGYAKSIADAHDGLVEVVTKTNSQVGNLTTVVSAVLAKAEDDEKKKEKGKEEEMHGDKACSLFVEAKKLLKKSKSIKTEAKAATDPEQAKSLKQAAKAYRKASARSIQKAQTEALAGRGVSVDYTFETRKAINGFLDRNPTLKGDLKMMHEDDDKEDEKKKAKKAYKKAKAPVAEDPTTKAIVGHSDAKGNQADSQDPESKNQDDGAVKAQLEKAVTDVSAMSEQVQNALNGLGLMKTTVQGLIDTVSARPTTAPLGAVVPLIKSTGETQLQAISRRIDEADDNGVDTPVIMKARDLLKTLDGVNQGAIHRGIFDSALNNAPAAVREIFATAA